MPALYLPLLLSIASLIICTISFFYFRSLVRRKTAINYLREELLSEIREEVSALLSAIDETTERDISLVETKETELKILLEEIDKRIKIYIKELENREEADRVYTSLGKNRYKAPPPEENTASSPAFPIPEFLVKEDGAEEDDPANINAREKLKELLMAGFSPSVIASRLGISIAEAEFAAALYQKRNIITET